MPRKQPFPPEADTQPEIRRPSGLGAKGKRRAEAPTLPPPKSKRGKAADKASDTKNSGIRSRRPTSQPKKDRGDSGAATVDEVTADLSKDPRRERDE